MSGGNARREAGSAADLEDGLEEYLNPDYVPDDSDLVEIESDNLWDRHRYSPLWLIDIYCLVDEGETDAAINVLFREIDDLLLAGWFDAVDTVLDLIDASRLSIDLIVAVLSITVAARSRLERRRAFVDRVRARLQASMPPGDMGFDGVMERLG